MMLTNLKALIVILAISLTIFSLAKPYFSRYMDTAVFVRRRNIFIVLTVLGLTTPSIWLYALIAMPIMYFAARKDDNPLALYVLIAYAVPNVSLQIPTIGIGQLLELNQIRMLSFTVLMPLMFRTRRVPGMAPKGLTAADWFLIGLGVLQLALAVEYEAPTNTLRRGLVFFLDTFVMYYLFARLAPVPRILREVLAMLTLGIVIMAAIGIFESTRGWLLYTGIGPVWGAIEPFALYITRGTMIRATASSGHPLALGYLTAIGLGLWAYLAGRESPGRVLKYMTFAVLTAGCYVAGSRGGWVTAMLLFVVYAFLRPNAWRFIIKSAPLAALAVLVAYNSPLKESVINKLPIIGNAEQDTVEYRQQIAEVSWRLIKQNPFFGDPFALRNMQELKQGQGIIDIMNGYANVAVFQGGVGFALFVGLFVIALWQCYVTMVRFRSTNPDLALMGACLISCLLASLFFVGTAAIHPACYWLSGIMMSYYGIRLDKRANTVAAPLRASVAISEERPLARRL